MNVQNIKDYYVNMKNFIESHCHQMILNRNLQHEHNLMLLLAKSEYNSNKIINAGHNLKIPFEISNDLLGKTTKRILPDLNDDVCANSFHNFFRLNLQTIIDSLPICTYSYQPLNSDIQIIDSLSPFY